MVLAAWFFEIGETGFKFCTAHKNACLKDFFQTGILLSKFRLFYGNRFSQVTWFVHIGAASQGRVVRQQLYRNGVHDGRQNADVARSTDYVYAFAFVEVAVQIGEHKQFAAACR